MDSAAPVLTDAERQQARADLIMAALEASFDATPDLTRLERLSGGNSRESWLVEVTPAGGGSQMRLVLRCDPDHWIRPAEMHREITGLRTAERAGVPVPSIIATSEEVDTGRPFVLIEFVEGETKPRRIMRDETFAKARAVFAAQSGEILGRLHRYGGSREGWEAQDPIGDLEARLESADYPSPVLEGAFRWLLENQPDRSDAQPIHGDYRLGNLIFRAEGIASVLDWETSHLCDGYEDLGWLCSRSWRYGGALPVGGMGTIDELAGAYADATGQPLDPDRLAWWTVYAIASWAAVCRQHRGDERPLPGDSMETSVVARQLCQQEYGVLLELEHHARR